MEVPEALDAGELEVVAQRLDADGGTIDRALEVVRSFIAERGLVLYGGLEVDYALRLRGDQIYPDGERPDFDVLSSRSVDDAYDLAEKLHGLGFKHVTAVRALHVQTMRVRVDFVVVADISYAPASILAAIPRLTYPVASCALRAGQSPCIEMIHPHWQFMDQHQAFCYPFRNPPLEPVFHRFGKDLTRFNKLASYYPFDDVPAPYPADARSGGQSVTIPVDPETTALHGLVGYVTLTRMFEVLNAPRGAPGSSKLPGVSVSVSDPEESSGTEGGVVEVTMSDLPGDAQMWNVVALATTAEPAPLLAKLGYKERQRFRPLMDLAPTVVLAERVAEKPQYPKALLLYVHPADLVAATNAFDVPASDRTTDRSGRSVRLASPQYLMMYFLLGYHSTKSKLDTVFAAVHRTERPEVSPDWYLWHYLETLRLVNAGATVFESRASKYAARPGGPTRAEIVNATPFSLTTQVLGDLNIGASQLMAIANDASSTKQLPADPRVRALIPSPEELKNLPARRYSPGDNRVPFDYAASPWFRHDGGGEPAD